MAADGGGQAAAEAGTVQRPSLPSSGSRPRKALTIGAVCKILSQEFEDISISKIRYLEDQKLLSPRRTQGGYRLYSQDDVERLRTILRLQRDEFLPLRVIRQELAAGHQPAGAIDRKPAASPSRRAVSVQAPAGQLSRTRLLEDTGIDDGFLRELEEYGIVEATAGEDGAVYDETDKEIARAAAELARFGVAGRNLRVFRTSSDREATLLEQILGPPLRSRNPERRKEAIDNLENLAAISSNLKQLLLVRHLRRLTS